MPGPFRGDLLVRARQAAGRTQAELALAAGVSATERIARWERGDEQPRPQFIPVLARALNVAPLDLLEGDSDRPDMRTLRLAAGLTVVDLASRTGLSKMTYNRLERGTPVHELSPETMAALALALNVEVDLAASLVPQRR